MNASKHNTLRSVDISSSEVLRPAACSLVKHCLFLLTGLITLFSCNLYASVDSYLKSIQLNPKALYAFFKMMPKGGDIHYHLAGSTPPIDLLTLAATRDYCIDPVSFEVKTTQSCHGIKSRDALQNHELTEKIIRAWSMKNFTSKTESAHDHFFSVFPKILPLISALQPEVLANSMQRAALQNELYLETMILPDDGKSVSYAKLIADSKTLSEKKERLLANPDFQRSIIETRANTERLLHNTKQLLNCEHKPSPAACQVTVSFQYYVLREQLADAVFAQALHAFVAADQSHDLVGINLVQPEDGTLSLAGYKDQMTIFEFLHNHYPKVHISLHAGELSKDVASAKDRRFHIYDAVTVGQAERIGHGTDILEEDHLQEMTDYLAQKRIPIEINLSSNETILHVSHEKHPLRYYLQHKIPVVLSTDDEGILRTDLSRQYVIAYTQHQLNYNTLKQINRNALTYSFYPGKSLWADPQAAIPIPACQKLSSQTCRTFVKNNPKAKLQLKLENELRNFETRYS